MGTKGVSLEQRQRPQQPLQPRIVSMQLAGQARGVADGQDGGLGSSGHPGRDAPGQVSEKAPWLLGNSPFLSHSLKPQPAQPEASHN